MTTAEPNRGRFSYTKAWVKFDGRWSLRIQQVTNRHLDLEEDTGCPCP